MSADFPIPLMFDNAFEENEKEKIYLEENKTNVIKLEDGRKVHILIENPATKKPEPVPLTEDQIPGRYVLAFAFLFVVLAICMVCTFFATI